MRRRPRAFWEARVAELARGRSLESMARRHGVTIGRLRWWRWRLGSEPSAQAAPRMVEVLPSPATTAGAGVRVVVGDVVLELPVGTPPEYVGRVLGAARAAG